MSFHVVLARPEIPANTGNIIRLCANTGAQLHLIRPLGFDLDDKKLKRAGLDYHEYATVITHDNFAAAARVLPPRRFAAAAAGSLRYDRANYLPNDVLVFGCESVGLPPDIIADIGRSIYIPMRPNNRSLNLSNAVAVILMEAWRQQGFANNAGEMV